MSKHSQKLVIEPADRDWLTQLGLSSVAAVLKYNPQSVAAFSGTTETFPVDVNVALDAPACIYVKRYRYESLASRWKGVFRGNLFGLSRARFEFEFLQEMRRRGLSAVRPIAYGERRKRGLLFACFLITEAAPDTQTLDRLIDPAAGSGELRGKQRRRLFDALAREVARMHQQGVIHGGLFGRNILVAPATNGTQPVYFIDPDRGGRLLDSPVRDEGVVSDLAQLLATSATFTSRTERLRFLRTYFDRPRLTARQTQLTRRIRAAADRVATQEQHRLAAGSSMTWLQNRVDDRAATAAGGSRFESVETFFEQLGGLGELPELADEPVRRIDFTVEPVDRRSSPLRYFLTLGAGRVRLDQGHDTKADLHLRMDAETLKAIVNGQAGAFDLVASGRLSVDGDTRPLALLVRLIDRIDSGGIESSADRVQTEANQTEE